MAEPLLRSSDVSQRFGGLLAVDAASLSAPAGRITALIGPNGAGKTTLFAIISGFLQPSDGRVLYDGDDITGEPPHRLARRGIARTFQIVQPFAGLTVRENIAVGAHLRHAARADALAAADDGRRARSVSAICSTGRRTRSRSPAASASSSPARSRPSRGFCCSTRCWPASIPSEIRDMVPVIRAIATRGITILMIEHVMQAVMSLAEHVFVLAEGRIIAEGTPARGGRRSARGRGLSRPWRGGEMIGGGAMSAEPLLDVQRPARRLRRDRSPARRRSHGRSRARSSPCSASTAPASRRSTARSPASCAPGAGAIRFDGAAIEREQPAAIVARGLIHVPEGRRIFPNLTVRENLDLGGYRRAARAARARTASACSRSSRAFAERRAQRAGTLSGGEQQMLAIGRGLMAEPKL